MTYPFKISLDRCIGSCNDKENPYFKVCLPNIIENITVKSFDLLTKKNVLKNILLHKPCKCGCLLDEKICNNKQKWNKKNVDVNVWDKKIVLIMLFLMLLIVDVK